jgi:hypothetical protein
MLAYLSIRQWQVYRRWPRVDPIFRLANQRFLPITINPSRRVITIRPSGGIDLATFPTTIIFIFLEVEAIGRKKQFVTNSPQKIQK